MMFVWVGWCGGIHGSPKTAIGIRKRFPLTRSLIEGEYATPCGGCTGSRKLTMPGCGRSRSRRRVHRHQPGPAGTVTEGDTVAEALAHAAEALALVLEDDEPEGKPRAEALRHEVQVIDIDFIQSRSRDLSRGVKDI